jgi:hypothetical protein
MFYTTYATFESPSPTIAVSSPWTFNTLPTSNNPIIVNSGNYNANIRNTIKNILPITSQLQTLLSKTCKLMPYPIIISF